MNIKDYFLKHNNALPLFFILLIPVLFFFEPLIQKKVLYWGTSSTQFFPWMEYAVRQILSGDLPLWNPYNGWGAPLIANYQSALFYPINWLLIVFFLLDPQNGVVFGYTLLLVLHFQIGGLGFYHLLSRFNLNNASKLMGSMTFILSGYLLARINFISMIWAAVWMPWITYGVLTLFSKERTYSKKFQLSLVLPLTMQLLAGHAQTTYYTLLLVSILFIIYLISCSHKLEIVIRYLFSLALSVGLSAIQLIPTAEYLIQSQRSQEVGFTYATNYSFWPWRFLSVIFPDFWGSPIYGRYMGGGNFWEDHIYLGVFPFVFILFATYILLKKKEKIDNFELRFYLVCLGLVPLSIFMALGKNFFLFPLFYKYVPTFDMFQAPSRFLLLYVFSGAVLAAVGFEFWQRRKIPGRKTGVFVFIFVAVCLGVFSSGLYMEKLPVSITGSIYIGSGLAILLGLLTIIKNKKNLKISFVTGGVLIIVLFDFFYSSSQNGLFKSVDYYKENALNTKIGSSEVVYLEKHTEEFIKFNQNFRFDRFQDFKPTSSADLSFLPNTNLYYPAYHMINNFDPFVPGNYSKFFEAISKLPRNHQKEILTAFGLTKFVSIDSPAIGKLNVATAKRQDTVLWYDCVVLVPSEEVLNTLISNRSGSERYGCLILSENEMTKDLETNETSQTKVELSYATGPHHSFDIQYSSEKDGWLMIRSIFYPGWKAVLDNHKTLKIHDADYLFNGLQVPAGTHHLRFYYDPLSFRIGALITLISLLFTAYLIRKYF